MGRITEMDGGLTRLASSPIQRLPSTLTRLGPPPAGTPVHLSSPFVRPAKVEAGRVLKAELFHRDRVLTGASPSAAAFLFSFLLTVEA